MLDDLLDLFSRKSSKRDDRRWDDDDRPQRDGRVAVADWGRDRDDDDDHERRVAGKSGKRRDWGGFLDD